jgi:hypothetical protein
MRELHGVTAEKDLRLLKGEAILFDSFILLHPPEFNQRSEAQAEWEFLQDKRIVQAIYFDVYRIPSAETTPDFDLPAFGPPEAPTPEQLDAFARFLAQSYASPDVDVVGICNNPLPAILAPATNPSPSRSLASGVDGEHAVLHAGIPDSLDVLRDAEP